MHLRQRYVHLSQLCTSASSYSTQTLGHIDTEFSEQLDWLFYFQDICRLGIQPLTLELIRALCNEWLLASVLRSLEQATLTAPGEAADLTLRTTIALSALTQLFHIFDATALPKVLYAALFCAQPQADHSVRALMHESALAEGSGLKEWEEVIEAVTSTPDEMFEQIGSGCSRRPTQCGTQRTPRRTGARTHACMHFRARTHECAHVPSVAPLPIRRCAHSRLHTSTPLVASCTRTHQSTAQQLCGRVAAQ